MSAAAVRFIYTHPERRPMKITVNVDCTPEEARTFFGLPDVKPMQAQLLEQLKDRLVKNIQTLDPEALVRNWFAPMSKAFENWQDLFLGKKEPQK
jgi:hypothetical protein